MAKVMSMGMDSDYQAEQDARCLVEAKKIEDNRKRFSAAKRWAKKKAAELNGMVEEESGEDDKGEDE